MKFIKIAAIVPFIALLVAGCSSIGNQSQANETQTNAGLQEQQDVMGTGTHVAQSSSCEKPPMTMEWFGKTYSLKENTTPAEPGLKFGYVSCDGGQFKIGDEDGSGGYVYSHGDPRTNNDLIFGGKWGLALYTMSEE
jgi:hypothetical protein